MEPSDLLADQYADASNLQVRGEFNGRFSVRDDHPHEWVFDHLDLPADADVLEIGCGPGTFWSLNADRTPDDWTVTLTDFSPGMIREARETLAAAPVDPRYAVADASRIPLDDDTVDAVVSNLMLYHVPDRRRALADVRRVLRDGGRLYASTVSAHNKAALYEMLNEVTEDRVERLSKGGFTFENGAEQLRQEFTEIESHRYESPLRVTDVDVLVAYVLSLPDAEELAAFTEDHVPALRELAESRMADGPIEMQSDIGLFVAQP